MQRVVVIPVYNDWVSVHEVVQRLDRALAPLPGENHVLLVDDGSTQGGPQAYPAGAGIAAVSVLRLRRNLGHQRALAVGLSYVEDALPCDQVVVMDGDGEDAPEDVPRLVAALHDAAAPRVVFAERRGRSEGTWFRLAYFCYRLLYRLLTGHAIRFGNFSAMHYTTLGRLVAVSELWNHYASAVLKARIPFATVPTDRGRRLAGKPQMSLQGLIHHGLSSISVFADVVGIRIMLAAGLVMLLLVVLLAVVVGIRLFTELAIPGWASIIAGVLAVLLFQAFVLLAVFVLVSLYARTVSEVLPGRDYRHYVLRVDPAGH
jgi:hypothetical protein